jgi:hypothetical protein
MMQPDEPRPDRDPRYSMAPKNAIEDLWKALLVPLFEATGTDLRTGDRITIPLGQWWEWFDECGRDAIRASDTHLNGGTQYQDVTVPRCIIVGLWLSGPPPKPKLPDLMRPEGGGYMPLYCAAQWIATEGGAIAIDPEDRAVWKRAFDDLLGRIASGEVRVVGVRDGEREPVPPPFRGPSGLLPLLR